MENEKKMTEQECIDTLNNIVPVYFENNNEKKSYESLVKKSGEQIKAIMSDLGVSVFKVDKYTVSITSVDKSHMDEDKLLGLVKSEFPDNIKDKIIKTREYIDHEALENAMYKGEINKDLTASMAKCMVEKTEYRLNVRLAKGGKKNDD